MKRETILCFVFFFQAEDGIRDYKVTGVQTCALPISAFSGSGEAICEEPSRLMPSASKDELMVFAVYMPPQAPTLGQAFFSMPVKSSSLILPAAKAPTASKAETMVRSLPFHLPGLIVPP